MCKGFQDLCLFSVVIILTMKNSLQQRQLKWLTPESNLFSQKGDQRFFFCIQFTIQYRPGPFFHMDNWPNPSHSIFPELSGPHSRCKVQVCITCSWHKFSYQLRIRIEVNPKVNPIPDIHVEYISQVATFIKDHKRMPGFAVNFISDLHWLNRFFRLSDLNPSYLVSF